MDELLTVEQAAKELQMHPGAVRRAILAGRVKATRIGARLLVLTRAEVERYRAEPRQRGWPKGRPRQIRREWEDKS